MTMTIQDVKAEEMKKELKKEKEMLEVEGECVWVDQEFFYSDV